MNAAAHHCDVSDTTIRRLVEAGLLTNLQTVPWACGRTERRTVGDRHRIGRPGFDRPAPHRLDFRSITPAESPRTTGHTRHHPQPAPKACARWLPTWRSCRPGLLSSTPSASRIAWFRPSWSGALRSRRSANSDANRRGVRRRRKPLSQSCDSRDARSAQRPKDDGVAWFTMPRSRR